jgi:two-component system, chemotaxis family, response regulator PixG
MIASTQREMKLNNLSFKESIFQFKLIKEKAFSGNVIVRVASAPQWMFSFSQGRLVSVSGGIDPVNRWQRNLEIASLDLPSNRSLKTNTLVEVSLDPNVLAQQAVATEVLFDVIQLSQLNRDRIMMQFIAINSNNNLSSLSLPLLDIELILNQAIQDWKRWISAGLIECIPSHFPIIDRLDLTAINDLQYMISSINGERSLRSLAIYHHQHLFDFTQSLLPLFKSGSISRSPQPKSKLTSIATLSSRSEPHHSGNRSNEIGIRAIDTKVGRSQQLIACIDDSVLIYQYLERILTEHGYRSFGVQDPLKIMPSLIKNKPDFIFLDLLMPITNGYEVCERIRKTPRLKDVPVVILTGKDGLIDRMRAKIVGANGFLSKPVRAGSVLTILDKHLKNHLY